MSITGENGKGKYLFFLLLIGFVLRIIPVLWGVPLTPYVQSYHPDEPKVYATILNFPKVYLNFDQFLGYGTCVQYAIGLFLFFTNLIFSKLLMNGLNFSGILIVSRFFSIMMGTFTIYLTYRLANKVFNAKTALLSAAFVSVSFYHVLNSSIITLDVAMSMLLIINFLLAFKASEDDLPASYAKLGIATAFLLGTKITGGLFLAIPFMLSAMKVFKGRDDLSTVKSVGPKQLKCLSVYAMTTSLVFAVFHPHIFMDFPKYIDFYLKQKVDWVDRLYDPMLHTIFKAFEQTSICVGLPVIVLAVFGLFMPWKNNFAWKGMLIFMMVLFYGFWRWHLPARFVIFIAPLICMYASHLCVCLLEMKTGAFKILGLACIALGLGYSLYCCAFGIYLRLNDTRPVAAHYLDQLDGGLTLGIPGVSEQYTWKQHPWRYPKIDFNKFKETDFWEKPEIFVLSSYDFNPVLEFLKSGQVSEDYVVDEKQRKDWYMYSPPSPRILKLYDDLMIKEQKDYILIQSFKENVNVPVEFPPPEILIYKRVHTES